MNIKKFISQETIAQTSEIALRQLDQVGYHLSSWGVTDKINRHNCIARLITEDQRLRGELSRLELKVGIQKMKVNKLKGIISDRIDDVASFTPAPINKPLMRLKTRLLT